ncbi:MAG: beta-ketoacyl-ACP synthase II [Anaerolineales bacterium]|jgi:3-oxoacyl-[acyl-carrier-protein] synthase II|uniref:beta-ketoacyl-ACP synthase II n=1 Tax=Candidatus Villigracilis affinis TaxID=3140682 RepID=UPI001B5EFCDC|nr:beta-ketoacyl-ACP synthase II [Anaerolineales bacterium]MBK9602040.1 beta-ketoacyl-ACP synthase II [Anaerolineales bacterium]MBL0347876.1 beta-ketoacyl-ACP synthase II [Anaerolineales bacterium]MBP8048428.1 beta-ketoacyl-ACP synthase II [Anaerolineales bacterium]
MRKRVVVTGLGCVSPVGNNSKDTWQALLAGKSGAAPITTFDASAHKTKFAAEVKGFDPVALFGTRDARKMDRFTQFATAATLEAVEHASLKIDESNRDRIGILIGTGIGGISSLLEQYDVMRERGPDRVSPFLIPMMISDGAAGNIAIRLGVRGPNMSLATACASGTNALGEAAEMIRRGSADVMIAGASEAAINAIAMAGMNSMTALSTRNDEPLRASRPFDKDRDGFMMGEGAGVLILESLEYAQARGANILCEFSGYGTTDDAHHISAPSEDGAGAVGSMSIALADAGLKLEDISYINAHGTSTYLNDKSETSAIKTVFGELAYKIPVSSTKSMTGHLLGASGAVEAVFCALTIMDNILPPTMNYETPDPVCDLDYVPNQPRKAEPNHVMSNSFGFGGHNATLVLSRFIK